MTASMSTRRHMAIRALILLPLASGLLIGPLG